MTRTTTSPETVEALSTGNQPGAGDLAPVASARRSKRSIKGRTPAIKTTRPKKRCKGAVASGTKQDLVLQKLRQRAGASIPEIASKTGWQSHSVRGFFSAVVRKRLKLRLQSDVGKDGVRRYRITQTASSKR